MLYAENAKSLISSVVIDVEFGRKITVRSPAAAIGRARTT
jgi:hypothetical protein